MAKGVNKVFLLGNVGRAPEVRTSQGGMAIASFSLATPDRRKDTRGEWQEVTEWHNLVAFGRTAEIIRDYAGKGSKLYVEGKLQTRSWDDKKSGEKKYKTEILVNEVTLLGGKSETRPATTGDADEYLGVSNDHGASQPYQSETITDEDIPF